MFKIFTKEKKTREKEIIKFYYLYFNFIGDIYNSIHIPYKKN